VGDMARLSLKVYMFFITIGVIGFIISSLFLFPYYTATQLSAEYFGYKNYIAYGEPTSRYRMDVNVAFQNKGFLDLTIRNVQLTLIADNQTLSILQGLPSEMTGEEGFTLRMSSYRNYTLTYDITQYAHFQKNEYNVSYPYPPYYALIVNWTIVSPTPQKIIIDREVSCLWYTRRFTIDLIITD
jgi:hypothetical protein